MRRNSFVRVAHRIEHAACWHETLIDLVCFCSTSVHLKEAILQSQDRQSGARPCSMLKNAIAELISQEEYTPPGSQGHVCSHEKKRNILEIFHHLEARQKVKAMLREQARIHKHEVRFARAQEFQGRQTIRSDDDLVASLLCQYLTKL